LGTQLFVSSSTQFWKTFHVGGYCGYTFFRESPKSYSLLNTLIRRLAGITSNELDATANVLVMKHIRSERHTVVDYSDENIPGIDSIIER
jgi:hypothetical protein